MRHTAKYVLTRDFWIPGIDTQAYQQVAIQVAKDQLGDVVEDLVVVNMKTDNVNGRISATLFATGDFSEDVLEKGVDKWIATTPEGFANMLKISPQHTVFSLKSTPKPPESKP